ncbi:DBD_Tnp_Mut domain-containing protein [Raphanus sativus]|nr:DBD_Tnp_Mut domain-containing protein [Raphanus sativus]
MHKHLYLGSENLERRGQDPEETIRVIRVNLEEHNPNEIERKKERSNVDNWQRLAHGTWRFDINHIEVKYDLVLKENEIYGALVSMWMKVHEDFTTPPVDIVEDQDVEFFMTVRMDFAGLTLCVVYGSQEVGHYRTIWRDEFGLTEDGTEVIPPKPKPWRGELF